MTQTGWVGDPGPADPRVRTTGRSTEMHRDYRDSFDAAHHPRENETSPLPHGCWQSRSGGVSTCLPSMPPNMRLSMRLQPPLPRAKEQRPLKGGAFSWCVRMCVCVCPPPPGASSLPSWQQGGSSWAGLGGAEMGVLALWGGSLFMSYVGFLPIFPSWLPARGQKRPSFATDATSRPVGPAYSLARPGYPLGIAHRATLGAPAEEAGPFLKSPPSWPLPLQTTALHPRDYPRATATRCSQLSTACRSAAAPQL